MTTIRDLLAREQELLAAQTARKAALNDALAQFGRLAKAGGAEFVERAIKVRTDLAAVDVGIRRSEARIRLLESEQTLDEKVAALSGESVRMPDHDSPEYPAHRQRMDEEADKRRAEIEREQDAIVREWAGLR